MRETDIPFETLVAFVTDELGPTEADRVRERVARSPQAARDVAELREAVEAMRADEEPGPHALAEVIGQAARLPRGEPAPPRPSLVELGAMVARLVFDSRRPPAAAGLRGDGGSYQLAYESDLARVDLQVTNGRGLSDERRVRGQLVPHGADLPATVRLVTAGDGETACACSTDARGRFKLLSTVGIYDAVVGFPERPDALVLPGLELD